MFAGKTSLSAHLHVQLTMLIELLFICGQPLVDGVACIPTIKEHDSFFLREFHIIRCTSRDRPLIAGFITQLLYQITAETLYHPRLRISFWEKVTLTSCLKRSQLTHLLFPPFFKRVKQEECTCCCSLPWRGVSSSGWWQQSLITAMCVIFTTSCTCFVFLFDRFPVNFESVFKLFLPLAQDQYSAQSLHALLSSVQWYCELTSSTLHNHNTVSLGEEENTWVLTAARALYREGMVCSMFL